MAGKGVAKLLDRCSFDGATLVHTDDGLLRIDQVRPGMSVLSGDPVTGDTSYQTVLDKYSNDYDKTVYITYEGADGPEEITSNTIHPFFVVLDETTPRLVAQSAEGHIYEGPIKGGAWIDVAHLRPGHNLRTPDGTLRKVLTVNITTEPLTAYNLTVDQTETYFVGEEPVWVHNACDVSKRIARQQAAQRGRDAEKRVLNDMGMEKNTQRFEGPEGKTIPDAIDDTKLVEIKDAKRVTDSRLARNQETVAKKRGVQAIFVTGTKTKVSPKAESHLDRVDRRDDLGPDE